MARSTDHISIGAKFSQTISAVVYGTLNVFSYFLVLASGVLVHTAIVSLIYYVVLVRRQKTWSEASKMDPAASIIMPTWILTMITFVASLIAFQDEPFWLRIACIVVGVWTAVICLVLLGSLVFLIVVLIYAVVSVATKKDLPTSDPKKSTVGTVEDKSAVGSSG